MEESFDLSLLDGSAAADVASAAPAAGEANHGWQKVTNVKRQRRQQAAAAKGDPDLRRANGLPQGADRPNVFSSVEQMAQERHLALKSAAAAAAAAEAGAARTRHVAAASDEDDDSESEAKKAHENGEGETVTKVKQRKPKKPKVTVAEASAKIDAADLAAFLVDISSSYESQQDIQLMRFADYFARSFVSVSPAQFPWAKMLKESPVAKISEIPLNYISDDVYKTSVDWLAQKSPDALSNFILWCFDGILADLAAQQTTATKGSKKHVQQNQPKAQVAIFVALAMAVRRKPDLLISLLPRIKDNQKYQGQEKLAVLVWITSQASQGDRVVGMYVWSNYLFPLVCGKSSGNPQSRDLVLQLVERILSGPKARPILLNGAVRKGERLIPPATFDLLMRMSFPSPSARIKATERFEAVYPTLKELALAGSPGSKTIKQASQQLLTVTMEAMKENNPELIKEATDVFIWCLAQNVECCRLWEKHHLDNVDASVAVLKKISDHWKQYSAKISPDVLKETLKHLRIKNEEALSSDAYADKEGSIKDAEKYCKAILGKLSRGSSCFWSSFLILLVFIVVCAAVFLSMDPSEQKKLQGEWVKLQSKLRSYFLQFL